MKTINGEELTEEQWKARYVVYMKEHSNAPDWMIDEYASAAWEMTHDETPEESAQTELSYWAADGEE